MSAVNLGQKIIDFLRGKKENNFVPKNWSEDLHEYKKSGFSHICILEHLHKKYQPKTYLEIGVRTGRAIMLSNKDEKAIGVDPEDSLIFPLRENIKMFWEKSDDFFADHNIEELFGNQKLDLTFIDGMHLFEFVLRDFINAEKHSHKDSVIMLHDTIPFDKPTSGREIVDTIWTGDVFKMILILKKYRPDLKFLNIVTPPIGTTIVKNLDPNNTVLKENYDKILEEFMQLTFDDIETNMSEKLNITVLGENQNAEIDSFLNFGGWQN